MTREPGSGGVGVGKSEVMVVVVMVVCVGGGVVVVVVAMMVVMELLMDHFECYDRCWRWVLCGFHSFFSERE